MTVRFRDGRSGRCRSTAIAGWPPIPIRTREARRRGRARDRPRDLREGDRARSCGACTGRRDGCGAGLPCPPRVDVRIDATLAVTRPAPQLRCGDLRDSRRWLRAVDRPRRHRARRLEQFAHEAGLRLPVALEQRRSTLLMDRTMDFAALETILGEAPTAEMREAIGKVAERAARGDGARAGGCSRRSDLRRRIDRAHPRRRGCVSRGLSRRDRAATTRASIASSRESRSRRDPAREIGPDRIRAAAARGRWPGSSDDARAGTRDTSRRAYATHGTAPLVGARIAESSPPGARDSCTRRRSTSSSTRALVSIAQVAPHRRLRGIERRARRRRDDRIRDERDRDWAAPRRRTRCTRDRRRR